MDKVFEEAVYDYHKGKSKGKLLINNTYGFPDEMPLEVYFRKESELSDLESYALELCQGKILDVGAGLGALGMILQNRGQSVQALEISPLFCTLMRDSGLADVQEGDFLHWSSDRKFDTLLLMMNGFGLCGSMQRLPLLFEALERHLTPGGQVIFDSSDLSYLYDDGAKPAHQYYGEMDYCYEYDGKFGSWFKWLYIDSATLEREARQHGFELQVLFTEETGQYLGRLTRG